nr:hypothetical protein CFP56_35188 [Quercus suber]
MSSTLIGKQIEIVIIKKPDSPTESPVSFSSDSPTHKNEQVDETNAKQELYGEWMVVKRKKKPPVKAQGPCRDGTFSWTMRNEASPIGWSVRYPSRDSNTDARKDMKRKVGPSYGFYGISPCDAKWAILLKGKVIPIVEKTVEGIQRDPTDIMGWYEMEAMEAWKNLFPLTEVSARRGYLPIEDEAWITTPNPYWHFLMDKSKFPPLIVTPSQTQESPSWKPLCEKSLSVLEGIHLEPVISQRKILLNRPIELVLMENLFKVKLLQFSMAP